MRSCLLCMQRPRGNQIEHHASHRQASATVPLRTKADLCTTAAGSGAGMLRWSKTGLQTTRPHKQTEDHIACTCICVLPFHAACTCVYPPPPPPPSPHAA